ncbi:MAG: hypothetical protein NTX49_00385 [Chlamydiae bacterium]|nr:hypothetical protein [Chlamydiota bacterium]
MASSISAAPLRQRDEIQRDIEAIVGGPKIPSLLSRVAALQKEFRSATGLDLDPSLKGRILEWLRLPLPAVETSTAVALAANSVLSAAGCSSASLSSATTVVARLSPSKETDRALAFPVADEAAFEHLHERRERLHELLNMRMRAEYGSGCEDFFVLYIIRQMMVFASSWGDPISGARDKPCLRRLDKFLFALGISDPGKMKKELFSFFCEQLACMKANNVGSKDYHTLAFQYGLEINLRDQIDLLCPLAAKAVEMRGSTSPAKIITLPGRAVHEAYLTEALDKGCQAAQYLAEMTYAMGNESAAFLKDKLKEISVEAVMFPPMQQKIGRKDLSMLIDRIPALRKISPELRISAYIQFLSFYQSITGTERTLDRLYLQFSLLVDGSAATLKSMRDKLLAINATHEVSIERSIQFSLMKEHYEEILDDRKLHLSYLEEVISAIREVEESTDLSAYAIMFHNDAKADFRSLVTRGYREVLLDYKKTHLFPDEEVLEAIKYRKQVRRLLTKLHAELSRTNDLLERTYLADFKHLHELHQSGIIDMGGAAGVAPVFRVPSPPSRDVVAEGVAAASLEPSCASEEVAGSAVKATRASRLSGADFCRDLQEIVPDRAFTSGSARDAYLNALHYVESLYTLLTEAPRLGVSAKALGQGQMDIGFAGFHALEQLLTAIMLEKANPGPAGARCRKASLKAAGKSMAAEEDNLSHFQRVGHSLIRRLLLAKIRPQESIRSLLRDMEGMEFAIRDLPRRYTIPSLLENTLALLSHEEAVAETALLDEERKTRAQGQRMLESFVSLLSMVSSNPSVSLIDFTPYFDTVGALIPEPLAKASGAGSKKVSPSTPTKAVATPYVPGLLRDPLGRLTVVIEEALENSEDYQSAMMRKLTLDHNLNRYRHLRHCLSDPSKLELFPFYINQARFVLCTITEEFLCAAHENKIGPVGQRDLAHNLVELASALKLSGLDSHETAFLQRAASERNEARYGDKVKGHVLPEAAILSLEASPSEEGISSVEGFEMALGSRYESMIRGLEQEFGIVEHLCSKVSKQSFGIRIKASVGQRV